MKFIPLTLSLSVCYMAGCNNSGKGTISDKQSDSSITTVKDNTQLKAPVTIVLPNGLSKETLTLKSVNEGAYPLASLHAELKDGKSIDLTLNQEDPGYSGPKLQELKNSIGRKLQVTYSTSLDNNAMIIGLNNENILDGKPINPADTWDLVSGTLEAPAVSGGDLPDTFHIKKSDGTRLAFPFFITKEMVEANGIHVDVYYTKNETYTVRSIQPANQ